MGASWTSKVIKHVLKLFKVRKIVPIQIIIIFRAAAIGSVRFRIVLFHHLFIYMPQALSKNKRAENYKQWCQNKER